MSTNAVPTKDEPMSDQEFSDYRQPSDIVITVDTGNSVCSTILVEGCSDDLDLSLNDDDGNCEKTSEAGEEQEQPQEAVSSRPRRTRGKPVTRVKQEPVKVNPPRKGKKARKTKTAQKTGLYSENKKNLYLRSAVLSRDEITREVLHRSRADIPKPREASLFTTKLMMRLASRLPPSRARPTCEELKDLMNAQRDRDSEYPNLKTLGNLGNFGSFGNLGQGTPLRVKAERPSFCETISHIMQVPTSEDAADFRSNLLFNIACSNPHCREEREQKIALLQQQSMQEMEEVREQIDTSQGLASLSIERLQEAMRDSNCPNRKEIEKQIALHQLESLRGRRGRPSLASKNK